MNFSLDQLKKAVPPTRKEEVTIKLRSKPVKKIDEDEETSDPKISPPTPEDIDAVPSIAPKKKRTVVLKDKTDIGFDRSDLMKRLRDKSTKKSGITIVPDTKVEKTEEKAEAKQEPKIKTKKSKKLKKTTAVFDESDDEPIVIKPKSKKTKKSKKTEGMPDKSEITIKPKSKGKIMLTDEPKISIKKPKYSYKPSTKEIDYPESMLKIGSIDLASLVKKPEPIKIRPEPYYLNNRQVFVNFIANYFAEYREEMRSDKSGIGTSKNKLTRDLMTHQKLVKDYMNMYSPYRGLLLYHGLGSGKTCASIAIAEGLKDDKRVVVMTPASLQMNYRSEIQKCGSEFYKMSHYWKFIRIRKHPDYVKPLSQFLQVDEEYIVKNGGAWLVNMNRESNYETLTTEEKQSLQKQITHMIEQKYTFINYNGLREKKLDKLSEYGNPFDNTVVIIDEAHNFISRIVNKLKKRSSLSMRLYEYLLSADNCRVVLLSGTPIINYPNEIGILFNIIRGYIKVYEFSLQVTSGKKLSERTIKEFFKEERKARNIDYVSYNVSLGKLTIIRNPFGFQNSYSKDDSREYQGVIKMKKEDRSDEGFQSSIRKLLTQILQEKKGISVSVKGTNVKLYKALPDDLEAFRNYFIKEDGRVMNMNLFKRRILGLSSYFRSAKERLLPRYEKERDFHVVKIPMSDHQFGEYLVARKSELDFDAKQKSRARKGKEEDIYSDTVSTYRIFSRAFCNFVFPSEFPRPMPTNKKGEVGIIDEDDMDVKDMKERLENPDGRYSIEDSDSLKEKDIELESYEKQLERALQFLKDNADTYLSPEGLKTYSPKMLTLLGNIASTITDGSPGTNLIYSQFRTLEGIGILKLVLEANDFAEFKIKRDTGGNWVLDIAKDDMDKPKFALYTGTETVEEKEIIRNIFNSNWEYVPSSIVNQLREIGDNNYYGEIIKVIMITASGAEGINLENVRYVHIMEPYWHPVRMEQVIGRARRIGSHMNLPEEFRTVDVYLYLMTLTDEQRKDDASITIRNKDKSKIDHFTVLTSDEALYEISNIKEGINRQLLKSIKEAAIDCTVYMTKENKEKLTCFSFGDPSVKEYSYIGSYQTQEADKEATLNTKKITWKTIDFTLGGRKYKLRLGPDGKTKTNMVYDYDSVENAITNPDAEPLMIGYLEVKGKRAKIVKK
jgi:hypothetical protein